MLGEEFSDALDRARFGDEHAFVLLYRDIQPPLLRYLRVMSWDLGEDAASETWLEITRSLDSFNGPERAFRAWVFAIARRKLIDRIRYETRRPTTSLQSQHVGPVQRDVAHDVVEMQSTQQALAMVATLPADQGEAVMLRVVVGLEYDAIAEVMERSSGAVRVLVHRGLRRLARNIEARSAGSGGVTP